MVTRQIGRLWRICYHVQDIDSVVGTWREILPATWLPWIQLWIWALVGENCATVEFESDWVRLVHISCLERNAYISNLHRIRARWAEISSGSVLFWDYGYTATRVNECISEMVLEGQDASFWVRTIILACYFKVQTLHHTCNIEYWEYYCVLCTKIIALEKHALESYTRNMFQMVSKQLRSQSSYSQVDKINHQTLLNIFLPSMTLCRWIGYWRYLGTVV